MHMRPTGRTRRLPHPGGSGPSERTSWNTRTTLSVQDPRLIPTGAPQDFGGIVRREPYIVSVGSIRSVAIGWWDRKARPWGGLEFRLASRSSGRCSPPPPGADRGRPVRANVARSNGTCPGPGIASLRRARSSRPRVRAAAWTGPCPGCSRSRADKRDARQSHPDLQDPVRAPAVG